MASPLLCASSFSTETASHGIDAPVSSREPAYPHAADDWLPACS